MFDFPNTPSPGDNYQGYIWDGEKWTTPVAAAATSAYVLKGGDTMIGNLTISKATPTITMDCTDTGQTLLNMTRNRSLRWFIYGQAGAAADFGIARCADNGAYVDSPITISRADGHVTLGNPPTLPSHATTKLYVDNAAAGKVSRGGDAMQGPLTQLGAGQWRFAGAGAGSWYDSVSVQNRFFVGTDTATDAWRIFSAGKGGNVMTVDGATGLVTFPYGANLGTVSFGDIHGRDFYATRGDGTGVYYFAAGAQYLFWNGGYFQFQGGPVYSPEFRTNTSGTSALTFDGTNTIIKSGAATVFQRSDGLQYGAIDANAMIVYSQSFYLNNTPCLQRVGTYTNIADTNGNLKFSIGGNADPTTLHRNVVYKFQSPDGSTDFMTLADSGITVNKTLSCGTSLNAGQAIYSGDTITAAGGTLFLNSRPGGQAAVWYRDENSNAQAVLWWDRANNAIKYTYSAYGVEFSLNANGRCQLGYGFAGRQGIGGGSYQYNHNFFWDGSNLQAWVDYSNVGNVYLTSDYRAKKEITPLQGMWEKVKALRPISYTHRDFTPPGSLAKQRAAKLEGGPLIKNDDATHWGFNAHELQETLLPTAASAKKDAEDAIQSPNPMAVIAALTKALQEAMTRIEALEEKLA
jgi:hypothetical protein